MKLKITKNIPILPLIIIGAIAFQGCTSLQTISMSHPGIVQGDKVVVELQSGESKRLDLVAISETEIEGYDRKGDLHSIDLSGVDRLAVRQYDKGKTKALVGAVAVVGAIGAGVVLSSAIEDAGAAAVWGSSF